MPANGCSVLFYNSHLKHNLHSRDGEFRVITCIQLYHIAHTTKYRMCVFQECHKCQCDNCHGDIAGIIAHIDHSLHKQDAPIRLICVCLLMTVSVLFWMQLVPYIWQYMHPLGVIVATMLFEGLVA